jgi:hypothetical protein
VHVLIIITLIIPYGVFTRYVLNSAASWPEPIATLLMIIMSFFAAIVCYREYLHIGVGVLPTFLTGPIAPGPRLAARNSACWPPISSWLVWGIRLVEATWYPMDSRAPGHVGRLVLCADSDLRGGHESSSSSSGCGRSSSSPSPMLRRSAR